MGSRWKTPEDIQRDFGMLSGPANGETPENESNPVPDEQLYVRANTDLIEKCIYKNRERNRDERLLFQPAPMSDFNIEVERKLNEDYQRSVEKKSENVNRNVVLSQFRDYAPRIVEKPIVPALSDNLAFPPLLKK